LAEPITLVEAKETLWMVEDDSRDDYIESLIAPARAYVERVSTYSFVAGQRSFTFATPTDYLEIYLRPITALGSITYGPDDTAYENAVAPLGRYPFRVYPSANGEFPDLDTGNVLTVTVTAGAVATTSPEYLIGKQAMLLLIRRWFREDDDGSKVSEQVAFAVECLLDTIRPLSAY
jgi:hypothetical protein